MNGNTLEPESVVAQRAVSVTVLVGFLDANKTSLLKRILSGNHGLELRNQIFQVLTPQQKEKYIQMIQENLTGLQ